jgi:hypothetical protein
MVRLWVRQRLPLAVGSVLSLFSLIWALSLPFRTYTLAQEVGFACAVLCLSVFFVYIVSTYWADTARKQKWSPAYCQRQGLYMAIYLPFIFCGSGGSPAWLAFPVGSLIGLATGIATRRKAYPTFDDEQVFFSKQHPTIFTA